MPIEFSCKCGKTLRVNDEFAGRKFKCPGCGEVTQAQPPAPPASDAWLSDELLAAAQAAPAIPRETRTEARPPARPAARPSGESILDRVFRIVMMIGAPFSVAALGASLASKRDASDQRQSAAKDGPVGRFIVRLLGILLLVSSPVVGFLVYQTFTAARASAAWPSVEGKITCSNAVDRTVGVKPKFEVNIAYTYTVDGREYTGSRVCFADSTGSGESAVRAVVDRYPMNSTPQVFYDPANPAQSVLEAGASRGAIILLAIPVLMLFAGAYLIWGKG
jgi:hypothetical protein